MTAPEHEQVVVRTGTRSGATIIVAVHSTALGTAAGGCRLWRYPDWRDGLEDVLRLSRAMTWKAALAGLELGGGKAVIALGEGEELTAVTRRAALLDLGDVVESLDGAYRTGEDVGTTAEDMLVVRERTGHVTHGGNGEEPTAAGTHAAISATLRRLYGTPDPAGRRIAIMGIGQVGGRLARRLAAEGAHLVLSDVDPAKRELAAELGAWWAEPGAEVLATEADLLVPAAVGPAVGRDDVAALRCAAIVGPADNQLAGDDVADLLAARGILWAPDFLVGAGGVIHAATADLMGRSPAEVRERVLGIGRTLSDVYAMADAHGLTSLAAATLSAQERLDRARDRRRPPRPRMRALLESLTQRYGVPGVSVGILDGEKITTYTAGIANLDTGVEVTADTVFQIGSNTKLLTAELIMQLVDEGLIKLDAPVTDYVPEFRLRHADASSVTIRHLLSHRGGFLGDFPGNGDLGWGADNIARYVAQLADVPQLHPVGRMWSYSNSGMILLGRVVERLTGLPYDRAVRERIAEPIGADSMLFRPEEILLRRAAVGHVPDPVTGKIRVAPVYLEQPWCAPSGSITVSTAEDVLRFVRHHLANLERAERMWEEQVAIPPMRGTYGWGLGWALRRLADGRRVVGHGGTTLGQVSALDVVPEAGVAVVVLTNSAGGGALGQRVVDQVLLERTGAVVADPVDRSQEPPALDLAAYAGFYDGALATMEVTADGAGLLATLRTDLADNPPPPPEALRLTPVNAQTFAVDGGDQYVHFLEPDGRGRPAFASALGRVFPRSR
ncbi:serine hydrolase [Nonomuraea sediminis]|uniref:serine hydrolase n=1 Tax=Nonomuraea sediminis TaxID=2835864 RepID=UPI001BDBCB95|nr:serine hydrolase [Nonomuraea sediminis]